MAQAEIIAVGNEILDGDVLDTNSNWICQQLTGLGVVVAQVVQVRDRGRAIGDALQGALKREPELIVLVGGLGPTEDDLTLQAVGDALGRALIVDPTALTWVQACYRRLADIGHVDLAEMTPARAKMARLPEGSEPLPNGVGAAPGVLLDERGAAVVCLPGVPAEMKDIFEQGLRPVLNRRLGQGYSAQWQATVACGDESVLSPILRQVTAVHPGAYIKSRAGLFGPDARFRITLSSRGSDEDEVTGRIEKAWQSLHGLLTEAGIQVISWEQIR